MTIFTPLIGRFGNQLFQYVAARSKAEREGHTLATPPWIGEQLFEIPDASRSQDYVDVSADIKYGQHQEAITYTRRDVLNWLRFKPEMKAKLDSFVPQGEIIAHLRRGDYAGYQYPLVSKKSYLKAAEKFGFNPDEVKFVSEEEPLTHPDFTGELAFLPDFYRMIRARVLLRANSSFSWWASTLGEALTFSPCIDGKPGGVESDCEFAWGNAQRLANLDFTTDLHLFKEQERYEYDLKPDSIVIDAGGYNGDFAMEIQKRFACCLHIFEPIVRYRVGMQRRFALNSAIAVIPAALGGARRLDKMKVKGDMSGLFADDGSDEEGVTVFDVAEMLEIIERPIALLKLNIEGMEFEVLERILECGITHRFQNIQVQFHAVVPDCIPRYIAIRDGLLKTHRPTFEANWCWENWELRK
jgi:FkbM family methyltransferase